MATEKPRLSISMDEDTFSKVLAYKKEKGIATQSKAIIRIMEMGLKDLERETAQKIAPSTAEAVPGEEQLISLYRDLNDEGREKLVDYADDLVSSGKYIKTSANQVGGEKLA